MMNDVCFPATFDHGLAPAEAAEAAGARAGNDVDDVAAIRTVLNEKPIIGAARYDSAERSARFAEAGASHMSFGDFTAFPTRPVAKPISTHVMRQTAALHVSRVAIGGITPDNGACPVGAGAEFPAAFCAILKADCGQAHVCQFANLYRDNFGATA